MKNVKRKDRPVERLIRIGEVKRLTGNEKRSFQNSLPTINASRPNCLPVSSHDAPLSFNGSSSWKMFKMKIARIKLRGGIND